MDPLLTLDDVADLAAINRATLPHRATLQRTTRVHVPGGVVRESTEDVRLNVPCRVRRVTPATQDVRARDQSAPAAGPWRIDLAADTPMDGVRRIVATGTDAAGESWTRAFRVVEIVRRTVAVMRVVYADEIPAGAGEGV